jgi:hypothetical protein
MSCWPPIIAEINTTYITQTFYGRDKSTYTGRQIYTKNVKTLRLKRALTWEWRKMPY